jgi:hypothetical protein
VASSLVNTYCRNGYTTLAECCIVPFASAVRQVIQHEPKQVDVGEFRLFDDVVGNFELRDRLSAKNVY